MLAEINTRIGKMIFCYLNGRHSIPLMLPIVRSNMDVEFYFHSRAFSGVDYTKSPLAECPNAHFVGNFDELKFKLNLFGAFITTDANAAHAHVYSLKLISMFRMLGIPVLELQHGMFQIGLHYYDVPSGVSFQGDSLPSKSFAERVLAFYPPIRRSPPSTVIGYPPYSGELHVADGGEYLLILTNLHWSTYTVDEREMFFESVVRLVEEHPDIPVVWKMHHGETPPSSKSSKMVQSVLERHPDAKQRIRFAHIDVELKDKTAVELIAGAKCVVSTVSTVLLDCEVYHRPTAVYACASNECLVKMIEDADFFVDGDSLIALFNKGLRPIRSGKLLPYDNVAFRSVLDKTYRPSSIKKEKFLSLLMSQTFRDDFIARNMAAKDATIASLKKGAEVKDGTILAMKDELSKAIRECGSVAVERDAVKGELNTVRNESDALRGELAKAADENARLTAELSELRTQGEAKDSAIGECRRHIVELTKAADERSLLNVELSVQKAICEERDAAIGECRRRIADQEHRIAELSNARCQIESQRDELLARLSASQAEIDAQNAERDLLKGSLAAMKSLVDDRIAICDKTCADIKGQNDRLAKEKADVQGKLATSLRQTAELRNRLEKTSRELERKARELDKAQREVGALSKAFGELKEQMSLRKRMNRLVKGLLPYGVTCTWKRMAYGILEDRPLFAYPGFPKRCRRVLKFMLPYFAVSVFKRFRYGKIVPVAMATALSLISMPIQASYYGLFVGINRYQDDPSSNLSGCVIDAQGMHDAYTDSEKGFCPAGNAYLFTDYAARKSAVRSRFRTIAGIAESGDTVLYYQSSHGGCYTVHGKDTKDAFLCMTDEDYEDYEFAEDLSHFVSGVRVVVVLDTCNSAGMFKNKPTNGTYESPAWAFAQSVQAKYDENRAGAAGRRSKQAVSDVGWITAADWNEESWASTHGSDFTNPFVNGWKSGSADVNGDGYVTFWELFLYAEERCPNSSPQYLNNALLAETEAGLSLSAQNIVTLGKNGGTGGTSSVSVRYGQVLPSIEVPFRGGWTFGGYWTTVGAGGVQYYDQNGYAVRAWDRRNDVTLWAKWTCRVTLGKNGGTGGDDYVTVTCGQPMPTRTMPKRSGWTFAGYWTTTGDGGTQFYKADGTSAHAYTLGAGATLWAKWTCRVTLGKNGGTGGDSYVTATFNQPFPKRTMPRKSGWDFGGYWISSSSRVGQCYNSDGTGTASMRWTIGGSPTIWALWY